MFIEKNYSPAYYAGNMAPARPEQHSMQQFTERKAAPTTNGMNTAPFFFAAASSPANVDTTAPAGIARTLSSSDSEKSMPSPAYVGQNSGTGLSADNQSCPDASGTMPGCAPLAVPYVPFQQEGSRQYSHADALSNGTLYPGLNLPFHLKIEAPNVVNGPLSELQALDFVVHELVLYLDTHPDDQEAFQLCKQYAELAKQAHLQYAAAYGPLKHADLTDRSSFDWYQDPWPWSNMEKVKGLGR